MTNLIAKLEALTGPCREVDWLVLEACGWRKEMQDYDLDGVICTAERIIKPNGKVWDWKREDMPRPTASLDAALTLVDEDATGYGWMGHLSWPGYDNGKLTAKARADLHHSVSSGGNYVSGYGATPAIALCSARLRATDHTASEKSDC